MERKQLYRLAFNAARSATAPYWQNDEEKVREVRDMVCQELYGHQYDELADEELENVINELNIRAGKVNGEYLKKPRASAPQIKTLRFYGLICALAYASFDDIEHTDLQTKLTYTGESLRTYLRATFERKKGKLPKNIFRLLHINWLNPHSHRFLIEGGLRKFTKNKANFFYEYLEPQEAQYLINRYRQIAENVQMNVTLEEFMKVISCN